MYMYDVSVDEGNSIGHILVKFGTRKECSILNKSAEKKKVLQSVNHTCIIQMSQYSDIIVDIHCIDAAPGCGGMEESSCQIMQYYCYLCVFSLSMRCTMCRGSKCGPFLCKSRISSKHLFDKRFLIFFMGIWYVFYDKGLSFLRL